MTFDNDDDQRALGRVEGKIDFLVQQQEAAEKSRQRTHDQLDIVTRKQEVIQHQLVTLQSRLVAVEGPVADFSRWKERWVGAVMLIGIVFTGIGAIASWLLEKLANYLVK